MSVLEELWLQACLFSRGFNVSLRRTNPNLNKIEPVYRSTSRLLQIRCPKQTRLSRSSKVEIVTKTCGPTSGHILFLSWDYILLTKEVLFWAEFLLVLICCTRFWLLHKWHVRCSSLGKHGSVGRLFSLRKNSTTKCRCNCFQVWVQLQSLLRRTRRNPTARLTRAQRQLLHARHRA